MLISFPKKRQSNSHPIENGTIMYNSYQVCWLPFTVNHTPFPRQNRSSRINTLKNNSTKVLSKKPSYHIGSLCSTTKRRMEPFTHYSITDLSINGQSKMSCPSHKSTASLKIPKGLYYSVHLTSGKDTITLGTPKKAKIYWPSRPLKAYTPP